MKSLTRFPLLIVLATVLLIDHTSAEPVSPVEEGSEFLRMSLGDWRQVCCPSASYSKCINAKNEGGQLETCVGATGMSVSFFLSCVFYPDSMWFSAFCDFFFK